MILNKLLWGLVGFVFASIIFAILWQGNSSSISCGGNHIKFEGGGCCMDQNYNQVCDDMESKMFREFKPTKKCFENLIVNSQTEMNNCLKFSCPSGEASDSEMWNCRVCFEKVGVYLDDEKKKCSDLNLEMGY